MLPSLRLIVATFCCGFIMVFAGLRLATSINGIHQAMPVMAAHAAPVMVAAIGEQDLRRGPATVPVMYDLRFAVSATQPAPTPATASPVIDRSPPLMMPLIILPPIAQDQEGASTGTSENPENTVIAAIPAQPATQAAPAAIDVPLPEPATVDLTFSVPVTSTEMPSAAGTTAALPMQPSPPIDIPLPEPVTVDLTFSPAPATVPNSAKPESGVGPKSEIAPETDARAASTSGRDSDLITVAALPDDVPVGTMVLPIWRVPLPKPKAADPRLAARHPPAAVQRATRTAAAKAKPRRTAAAKRDDFDSFFNFPGGTQQ